MRKRTALLLGVMAGLLAGCAGTTVGMERATPPAYATGEGVVRVRGTVPAESAAASGHEHHMTRQDQPHVQ